MRFPILTLAVLLVLLVVGFGMVAPVGANVVLFTFDDGLPTTYENAYPILSAAGFNGTEYVIVSKVGTAGYSSWENLTTEYNAGWDIGQHGYTHTDFTSLSEANQELQLSNAATDLLAHNFTRSYKHISYPFGSYNADTLTAMANQNMSSGRTTDDTTEYIPQSNYFTLKARYTLDNTTSISTLFSNINASAADRVFIFNAHSVSSNQLSGAITPQNLTTIVSLIKAQGHYVTTPSELIRLKKNGSYAIGDARLKRFGVSESFSDIRNAAEGSFNSTSETTVHAGIGANTSSNMFASISRDILEYFAGINAAHSYKHVVITITSAGRGNELLIPNFTMVLTNYSGTNIPLSSDYSKFGTQILGINQTNYSWDTYSNYPKNITLNYNGLQYLNKTNNTIFGFRNNNDVDGEFKGTWKSEGASWMLWDTVENTGTSLDPYITIIYNSEIAPTSNFTANVTSGIAPLTVQFTDTTTGNVSDYLWTFGDGNTSSLQNPVHVFGLGTYTINLTVTNSQGSNKMSKAEYIAGTGDTTPPKSISSLTNSTPSCNQVSWSWTNPTDSDFAYVGILKNGKWSNTTSNKTTTIQWKDLPNNTAMFFNSTTVDLSGNQNLTHWVNSSATTSEFCSETQTFPQIFNYYCPAGRVCFGPFILWGIDPLVSVSAHDAPHFVTVGDPL